MRRVGDDPGLALDADHMHRQRGAFLHMGAVDQCERQRFADMVAIAAGSYVADTPAVDPDRLVAGGIGIIRVDLDGDEELFGGAAVALGRALEYVNALGVERVLAHDQALATRLADGLKAFGATVLTPSDDAHRGGIVTARYPGRDGEEVAARLNEAGVIVSPRFGATRFSLHHFNDERDVDAALHVLATILA